MISSSAASWSEVQDEPVVVVAFSFGLRDAGEPGPVNRRLAQVVESAVAETGPRTFVVAQWEIERELTRRGIEVDRRVDPLPGSYLDSTAVWAAARQVAVARGVHLVAPIAQPFLQLHRVRRLIERDGFAVVPVPVPWVGFDHSTGNRQWWTRGPLRLTAYAARQAITGAAGPSGRAARGNPAGRTG